MNLLKNVKWVGNSFCLDQLLVGNSFYLWCIVLTNHLNPKVIFETNSNDTKCQSKKKGDCCTDPWVTGTDLNKFYSLIIALDSVGKKKLWNTLNSLKIKTFLGFHSGMQRMKNPGSCLKPPMAHTPPPTPPIYHRSGLLLSLHVS